MPVVCFLRPLLALLPAVLLGLLGLLALPAAAAPPALPALPRTGITAQELAVVIAEGDALTLAYDPRRVTGLP